MSDEVIAFTPEGEENVAELATKVHQDNVERLKKLAALDVTPNLPMLVVLSQLATLIDAAFGDSDELARFNLQCDIRFGQKLQEMLDATSGLVVP